MKFQNNFEKFKCYCLVYFFGLLEVAIGSIVLIGLFWACNNSNPILFGFTSSLICSRFYKPELFDVYKSVEKLKTQKGTEVLYTLRLYWILFFEKKEQERNEV